MKIQNEHIYQEALNIIKKLYGDYADFREGQYEAIEATLLHHRTLVVQKTGWGKSLVYFACTKILRNQQKGVTIVVSPLLVLMENQVEAAEKLGLKCETLNSSVKDRRSEIMDELINDELDMLLVTPETLFKDDIQNNLKNIKIGLFVIDEAHCISDWGHDFRLDYSNLYKVIGNLPENVPVLATTATANDRVVADLEAQLGEDVFVSRGPLTRETLAIQVLKMKSKAERYAWILENIEDIPGSGIIYCLTQRDCDYLADFLNRNGIEARAYYSRNPKDEEKNSEAEQLFKENKIKALVATIKLGMGYDKGDISFVIHFQQPANIVSYYQQIGRAGRNIDHSYAFLMTGVEDEEIIRYFNDTAFPTEQDSNRIMETLEKQNGQSIIDFCAKLNVKRNVIEKALMFLVKEEFIYKDRSKYYLTAKNYQYNKEHYDEVLAIRKRENQQMKEFIETDQCYSKFIVNALDDPCASDCGICANCLGHDIISSQVSYEYIEKAQEYIDHLIMEIEPRKQWLGIEVDGKKKISHINEVGICLSKYGDIGYGQLVKEGKYAKKGMFSNELVGKSREVLLPIIRKEKIRYLTYVPSLRSNIVEDFAKRLAQSCGIACIQTLKKKSGPQQKTMENSAYQCKNAMRSFAFDDDAIISDQVILIDDIVDSKWTLTVCGYLLMEHGFEKVFPFVLADSSQKGMD